MSSFARGGGFQNHPPDIIVVILQRMEKVTALWTNFNSGYS